MPDDISSAQQDLDRRVLDYYAEGFDENDRLVGRSDQGVLEFERTQELITQRVPAGSRVLDVGGATGSRTRASTRSYCSARSTT